MRSSAKMQSLFDAEDDDEGMFGGTTEDIFAASPSQSPKKSVESASALSASALSASASEVHQPRDSVDGNLTSKPKPKATTAAAPKSSLFSDEEEDLFGGKSAEEKAKVEEKKAEVTKPRKPVGGVSMFGGIDLFAGKKPSFTEDKDEVEEEPAKAKQGKQFSLK